MNPIKYFSSKSVAVWRFYRDGFRGMTVGRQLWILILIKLAIIFLVLKLFFFPDTLPGDTDDAKARTVMERLMEKSI